MVQQCKRFRPLQRKLLNADQYFFCRYKLVKEGSLDDNSPYAYIMMSHFYADTCIGAHSFRRLLA